MKTDSSQATALLRPGPNAAPLMYRTKLNKAAFIMYPTGGGQRILGGNLKFLEQKKGGYENCLNISGGMLIFCKILSSFCNGFKRWEKKR